MAVVVYSVNPYRALFDDGGGARFSFNGVDQYATMPGWAANGKPRQYWFNFNADAVATGAEQVIVSGVDGGIALEFYLHATLPTLSIRYRSATGAQAIEGVTGIDIVPGNDYAIHVINLGTGSEVYVNNILIDILAFEASAGIQPALTHMGAGHELARFFGGQLWSDRLVDDSPIQDTYANMGDGNRYGVLEQPIVIEGDFEISFDWIRRDRSGTNRLDVLNDNVANNTYVRLWDSGSVNPDGVQLAIGGFGIAVAGALSGIAQGQHTSVKVVRSGAVCEVFVDDSTKGTVEASTATFTAGIIGASIGGAQSFPADSAFQNLIIKDLDNNLTWNYPLDEGPTTDTGPELIEGDPTLTGSLSTWDGSTMHLEGLNPTGTFEGTEVVAGNDYHVKFDYNTSATNTYISLGGGGNVAAIAGPAIGTYDDTLTAGGTGYILQILSDGVGDFSNFSIKAATGGSIIHNTDPSTGSDYNGAWAPDTAWTFIDSNTRFYPMNEGMGDTFKAYNGKGEETPVNDATIVNFTDNWS